MVDELADRLALARHGYRAEVGARCAVRRSAAADGTRAPARLDRWADRAVEELFTQP